MGGTLINRQSPVTVSCVACDSDPEILAVLQRVETVVYIQRHRLDADKFRHSRVIEPGDNIANHSLQFRF